MWSSLPEGKVAPQDIHTASREFFRDRDEQRRIAIPAGAVREHEHIV